MRKNILIGIFFLQININCLPAQQDFAVSKQPSLNFLQWRDSTYIPDPKTVQKLNPIKPIWVPFLEALASNVALNLFNNYIVGAPHARISFESVKNNFSHRWDWDADNLITNMWGHPFQGAIYYNLARSSGYGYWTSLGVTAFGSWQWELFMEVEPPAINDFVMTSLGGALYGEAFYRLSSLIISESTKGTKRFWKELAAGIYNPGRLINRLIYGRVNRHIDISLYEKEPNIGELGFGLNNVAEGAGFHEGKKNPMVTLNYRYGQPFLKRTYKPLDYFNLYVAINLKNQPVLGQFRIHGIVNGKQKTISGKHQLLWGLFQYIDYLHNNVYEIAGVSIGPGIAYRSLAFKRHHLAGLINFAFMPMAAANSDYAPNYKVEALDSARTYNMGLGSSAKIRLYWVFPLGQLTINYSYWWVHTLQGAPGDEKIGILEPVLQVYLTRRWFIGLQYLLYHRRGIYKDYDNINYRNNEQRIFFGFRF